MNEYATITIRTSQRWFAKFRSSDFSLKDGPKSSHVSKEVLRKIIRTNPVLTFTEMGFKLGVYQTTALNYIKAYGFVFRLFVWVLAVVARWSRYRNVAGLVMSSSPVPLKTRRVGQRCTLNLSRAQTSSRCVG
ncbi:hypothetical protein TNCV_3604261 [Trichonephila clavipes]|nr:hypothetical protein TNCV_3604261 [Trichonephila clavipes]